MPDKLKPEILALLIDKTGKTAEKIRPRISEIRRESPGLTMNAAAQVYAQKNNISIMNKLNQRDKETLSFAQTITQQVSVSKVLKVDRRIVNINSPVHNLSVGDRNNVSQTVSIADSALQELRDKIEESDELSNKDKEDYKSDIATIAAQIGKGHPNTSIVSLAWEGIKALSTIEGLAQFVGRVGKAIEPFLS